jgi:hypothetical protein
MSETTSSDDDKPIVPTDSTAVIKAEKDGKFTTDSHVAGHSEED